MIGKSLALLLAMALLSRASSGAIAETAGAGMAEVPGTLYRFPFRNAGVRESTMVKPFRLDRHPVTVREFLAFVRKNPEYAKSRIKPLFADSLYLNSWSADFRPPSDRIGDPVTEVSWFAAKAYCAEAGKRLPSTPEWEAAATAVPAGMDSSGYVSGILDWYAKPDSHGKFIGKGSLNAYGIHDLHGKIWEWTSDFNAGGPSRSGANQGKADAFFCGGAGQATADGVDYATFMRFSFRSSLKPVFSVGSLGFRCAQGD